MLELVLLATAALRPEPTIGMPRRAVVLSRSSSMRLGVTPEEEEAARKRMLAKLGAEPSWTRRPQNEPSNEDQIFSEQLEREAARQRMLAVMGGPDKLHRGPGGMFGIVPDDEDYGLGPRRRAERPPEIDLASGRPLEKQGDPFDDRPIDWVRKPALEDPNPPQMPDTLRAPGEARRRAEAEGDEY
jgi:hypothetical protein